MRERLQLLRAEIRSDRAAFAAQLAVLRGLVLVDQAPSPGDVAQAALALHHAYGAIEGLLARIARTLDGAVPVGPDWHQGLLLAMSLEIDETRPAVLSAPTRDGLRALLGFRHFLRHGYSIALDARRLEALRQQALALPSSLDVDLDAFDGFLRTLAARST